MANPQDYTTGGGANTVTYNQNNKSFSDTPAISTPSNFNPVTDTSTLNSDQLTNYNKINSTNLAPTTPLVIPTTSPTPKLNTTVTAPTGTTTDANGNAIVTPPTTKTDGSTPSPTLTPFQQAMAKVAGLGDQLATKGAVTTQLQNDLQLAQKTEQAAKDYNNYNQAKLNLQQQIDKIYGQSGITRQQANQQVSEISRIGNANLANLAVISQASQGLESAARQTIKDKIEAQFSPITDQIDFLTKFVQANQNDLSESEKLRIQQQADKQKTDLANITKIADDLHQNMLTNNAPQSTYAALDKITNDYIAGKITAQDAQSKYYQTAGQYGADTGKQLDIAYKQAQINKIYQDIKNSNITTNTTDPNKVSQYAPALSVILGSATFTKEQKASVINAVNNGEDPFTVIKNQAKNIMGQTLATNVDKFETAKSSMLDIQSALSQFYANGGTTSILNGNFEKVINNLGSVNDPKLVELATQIQSSLQIYRNAVSGTAYSVQEGKDIASIFPGINKSEGLNTAIINGRLKAFDSIIDGQYRNTIGKTYDTLKNLQDTHNGSNPFAQVLNPLQDTIYDSNTNLFNIPNK